MFEEHAVGILDECSSEHEPLQMFLSLPRKDHNNSSIVEMAFSLEARNFVAHQAYQSYLTDVWMGEIEHSTSSFMLLLSCFPGLFMFTNIYKLKKMTPEESEAHRLKKGQKNAVKRVGSKVGSRINVFELKKQLSIARIIRSISFHIVREKGFTWAR